MLRLGGVALGAFGLGLLAIATWHYFDGPVYGLGGRWMLLGAFATWLGLKMIRHSQRAGNQLSMNPSDE